MTQRDEGRSHRVAWSQCRADGPNGGLHLTVLVYRRHMPGKKRPTDQDAATARRVLLDGLARDADIFEVLSVAVAL